MMIKISTRKKLKQVSAVLKAFFVVFVLVILYLPIFYIIIQSVNADGTGNTFGGITFRWYSELFGDPELMDAIVNTLSIAFISTAASTILGTIFAIGINSLDRKRKQRLIFLNNVPIINADIVTGVFLMLVFLTFGRLIGINYPLGYITMLIAHIFFSIPYVILSVLPKLNEMDPNLYDAALDLGSKPSEAVMKIIVPTIRPGIITGMLIAFTMSIDDFIISYFTTGGGVANFSIWLYTNRKATRFHALPKAYAYNTVIMVLTLAILIIYNIIQRRKVVKN